MYVALTEHEYAAARRGVGELNGRKALARKVGAIAACRDMKKVERQRDARSGNWNGLGQGHLRARIQGQIGKLANEMERREMLSKARTMLTSLGR